MRKFRLKLISTIVVVGLMGATASYAPAKEPSKLELKLGDVKQKELVVEDLTCPPISGPSHS